MKEMISDFPLYLVALLVIASISNPIAAKEIIGVTVDPSIARITSPTGVSVKITVYADADPPTFCGLRIEYGASVPAEDIKIDKNAGMFPRVLTKTFTQPGTYPIKVTGKKVTSHWPCPGKASAVLVVEQAPAEKSSDAIKTDPKFFKSWF